MRKPLYYLSVLFLAVAAVSCADVLDPVIIINGDPPDPTPVTGSFTLTVDDLGGGVFSYVNDTGTTLTTLEFQATLQQNSVITAGPGPFVTDTISSQNKPNGLALYDILFGPAPASGGIAPGAGFSVNLNDSGTDPNGSGGWTPESTISVIVNDAPESASWLFFGGGLALIAGMLAYRRGASV